MVRNLGGRPSKGVQPAEALVTRRIRRLVDLAHAGNVHEASKVSGVPSATLRALYSGKNINPELKTLEALARRYDFAPGWFTDVEGLERVPPIGLVFQERVLQPDTRYFIKRWIAIPWASWPLPGVFNELYSRLTRLDPSPTRPVIGMLRHDNGTELIDLRASIALFLLSPLVKLEKEFSVDLLTTPGGNAYPESTVRQMRLIGLFWQDALRDMLTS